MKFEYPGRSQETEGIVLFKYVSDYEAEQQPLIAAA